MDNNYYSEEQQNNMQKVFYEEPVSVKEWVITLLIMVIPIVNLVMIFVWAFGGKQKKSKSNYFKAALIMSGIAIAFSIVLSIIIVVLFSAGSSYASQQNDFTNYLEDNYEGEDYNYNSSYIDNDNYYNDYYDYEDGNYEDYEDYDYYDYYDYYDDNEYEEEEDEDWESEDEENDTELVNSDYEYIFPDSDTEKLTESMAAVLSKEELRLAINEIYARHGRKFDDKNLQEYFNEKDWYTGTIDAKDFDESVFNKTEKYNIRLLSKYR